MSQTKTQESWLCTCVCHLREISKVPVNPGVTEHTCQPLLTFLLLLTSWWQPVPSVFTNGDSGFSWLQNEAVLRIGQLAASMDQCPCLTALASAFLYLLTPSLTENSDLCSRWAHPSDTFRVTSWKWTVQVSGKPTIGWPWQQERKGTKLREKWWELQGAAQEVAPMCKD